MEGRKLELIDDEELFDRFKSKKDIDAFTVLYEKYSKKVFAYCLRTFNDRERAKDVFQKVFTSVVEKKDTFKGGSFIAWLMIITRNYCLLEKRNKFHYEEIKDNSLISYGTEKNDFMLADFVRKQIEELPEEYKELIKMRYYDDFSYKEIAEIKDWSMAQVKIKIFRAKKFLMKALMPLKESIV